MSFNTKRVRQEYKVCASIGCAGAARHQLKVIYLNKVGWFCEDCTDSLMRDGLVTEVETSCAKA